jgi:hypothetical protein
MRVTIAIIHDRLFTSPDEMASWTVEENFSGEALILLINVVPEASSRALPASDNPIMMAILPVTVGGNILSIVSFPIFEIIKPAIIDTKPLKTIPNCATEIISLSPFLAIASAVIIELIAAI